MKKVLSLLLAFLLLFSITALFSSCSMLGPVTYSFQKADYRILYDGKDVTNDIPEELREELGTDEIIQESIESLTEEIKETKLILDGNTIYSADNPEAPITVKKSGGKLVPCDSETGEILYNDNNGSLTYFIKSFNSLKAVVTYNQPLEEHTLSLEVTLMYKGSLPQIKIGD